MSIATYSDLRTAIANFGNRADLTSRIPEFVTLATQRIWYGSQEAPFVSEPLRIRAMETSQYTSISARSVQLPTNFLSLRRFYISGDTGTGLEPMTPDEYWKFYFASDTGRPRKYTIEGENILFGPPPDGTYTAQMLFYQMFAALSGDSDTNWLLANAPGVYLYGSLIELYKYIRAFDKANESLNAFTGAINALMQSDKRDRFSTPWVIRSDQVTP